MQSKATAVVQMYHAYPDRSQWVKYKTGVVCFVKDNIKKSYYIRLIDLTVCVTRGLPDLVVHAAICVRPGYMPFPSLPSFCSLLLFPTQTKSMVYEQELYNQFSYRCDRPYFHSFLGDVSGKVEVEFGTLALCLLPGGLCCWALGRGLYYIPLC